MSYIELLYASCFRFINLQFNGKFLICMIDATLLFVLDDDNFRVLLCGSKNTGKSTFARFLANSVLNRYDFCVCLFHIEELKKSW